MPRDKYKKTDIAGGAGLAAGVALRPAKVEMPGVDPGSARRIKEMGKWSGKANISDLAAARTFEGGRFSNEQKTSNLAHKIKAKGFRSDRPVTVHQYRDGSIRVGNGHHRIRAAAMAGQKTVPIKIKQSRGKTATIRAPWAFKSRFQARVGMERGKPLPRGIPMAEKSLPKLHAAGNLLRNSGEIMHGPGAAIIPAAVGATLRAGPRVRSKLKKSYTVSAFGVDHGSWNG